MKGNAMKGSIRRFIAALALSPVIGLVPVARANLVTNGDFSLGNVGFNTDYAFSPGDVYPDGTYDLVTDPSDSHGAAGSFGDHTSGDGLMLMINGATTANQIVWSQAINVTPGQDYVFSMWVASWYPGNPSRLRVLINSVAIAPDFEVSSVVGEWTSFAATWNLGSDAVAIISIIDQETAAGGNDFVLDDIAFDLTDSVCGNGNLDAGEECDGGLGCTDCLCDTDFEPTAPPSLDCQPICGNGGVDPGEECDGMDDTACPGACLSDCTCGAFCGNGICDPGEDSCNCPEDCGTPPPSETPGSTCSDGLDNDCDGLIDSDDPDCGVIPTVSQWGLVVLTLLLLTGAKVHFGRKRASRTPA